MPNTRNPLDDECTPGVPFPMSGLVVRDDLEVGGHDARTDIEPIVDVGGLCHLAIDVLSGEGVTAGRLDLHLVDETVMAELNEEHMGHEGPTDVLSFPLELEAADGGPVMLGDVVLCPSVAARQAAEHVGTEDGEFQLLVIHGVLHVLGHDHAEPVETSVMQERERHYLSPLGVPHPVERSG